jgi:hypothetical protein
MFSTSELIARVIASRLQIGVANGSTKSRDPRSVSLSSATSRSLMSGQRGEVAFERLWYPLGSLGASNKAIVWQPAKAALWMNESGALWLGK